MVISAYDCLIQAEYYAPRGKKRLLNLGAHIAQKYLSPEDRLIGLVGKAGAGKSLLIRGMFPGLELTNDDNGINIRPLPLMNEANGGFFKSHSYHVDVRFETAFCQMWQLVEAVKKAIFAGRRVIVEHFDLLYPYLELNAEMLIGIGEEVIVTRPNVFGPEPKEITDIVFKTLQYRIMSHSAEDLVVKVLNEMGMARPEVHSDVKHGFVLEFSHIPEIDLDELEENMKKLIEADLPLSYHDEEHIKVGEEIITCTGPRLHVSSTGEIKNFRLLKEYKWDPINQLYMIAGLVGHRK
jgi:hypothetical protein